MKVILVLVLLYLANFATSYFLHKRYVAALKRVRKYGAVSTAKQRGGFRKKGKIVLLAFDEKGIITYGEKFEGLTVFSSFEEMEGVKGLTLDEIEENFKDDKVMVDAVEFIRAKFEEEVNYEVLAVESKDSEEKLFLDKSENSN